MPENVPGIHHVTAITGDVQRNVDFYVTVLGLRFIKKTVNFDVPDTYHLYFGDWLGTPGTAMTFFGWPHLPWGPQGSGQVSVVSFAVPEGSLDYWLGRLGELGIDASRTRRFDTDVVAFRDGDDMQLELVADASDARWVPWPEGPVDPVQAQRLAQYVALMTLRFHRDLPRLERQHRDARWDRFLPADEREVRVAVLGFGQSGRAIAHNLTGLGFPVCAWRQSGRTEIIDNVDVCAGDDVLQRVLARARAIEMR